MNRREILSSLTGALMLGKRLDGGKYIAHPFTYSDKPVDSPNGITLYRGFVRMFSGWKAKTNMVDEVSQYFGLDHPSKIIPFVSSTGTWGFTRPGSVIPSCWMFPGYLLNASHSVQAHEKVRAEMHEALCRLVDHFHTLDSSNFDFPYGLPNPPLVHPEFPEYYCWIDLRKAGVYDDWEREIILERERVERRT